MKKFLYLFLCLFFISCNNESLCHYYNYGAKPINAQIKIFNDSSADISAKCSFVNINFIKNKDGKIDVSYKTGFYDSDSILLEKESSTIDYIQLPILNNELIQVFNISKFNRNIEAMIALEVEVNKNGITEKITGLPVSKILAMENITDNSFDEFEKEEFKYSGYGYYYVNTADISHPKTFGKFISDDDLVDGLEYGLISMRLIIKDDSYEIIYD